MITDCSATCGFCTLTPSIPPSGHPSLFPSTSPSVEPTKTPTSLPTSSPTECVDSFVICNDLAESGGCYEDDLVARIQIQEDCPSSCSTCFNNTVSPTKSPSIVPTGGPSERPSARPSEQPSVYPTDLVVMCEDARAYCNLITNLCNSSNPEEKAIMENQCALTCGYCPLQTSFTPTSSPTSNPNSSPTVSPEGEDGGRRREDVSGITPSTVITYDYQNEMLFNLGNRVWIAIVASCSFVFSLVVICKFAARQDKVDRQKKGDFKLLGDEEMVYDVNEGSYIKPSR